jgi:ferredoxin
MVLLQMIVQVAVRAMVHLFPQLGLNGPRVRIVPISGDPRRNTASDSPRGVEERFRCCPVARLTQEDVDQVPIAINCAVKEQEVDLGRLEEKMEPELAEKIYELDRCIECGCCIAGCGTVRMRPDFVGAVGLNKIARFRLDPRDRRDNADFYELIGDDNGVFGCMSLLGCHDMCPKELPLATQIAFLRRKMVAAGWK